MKNELGGKIMKKKQKTQKCAMKRKLKFENYKICFEAIKNENKINHLEKNKTNINSFFC